MDPTTRNPNCISALSCLTKSPSTAPAKEEEYNKRGLPLVSTFRLVGLVGTANRKYCYYECWGRVVGGPGLV